MADFMTGAAAFVLTMVALGLIRVLYGPAKADRMMAAQLFGTGGIAALLLRSAATEVPAILDVALVLALLSGFASVAFVMSGSRADRVAPERADGK